MKIGATDMITIYQIHVSDEERVWTNPKLEAKIDYMMGFKSFDQESLKYFEATYEVDTDDLETAFEATNLWEGYNVKRLKCGSNTSIGDIAVLDGNCYFCDDDGWVAMGKYEGFK
jgi:hypothetical protein